MATANYKQYLSGANVVLTATPVSGYDNAEPVRFITFQNFSDGAGRMINKIYGEKSIQIGRSDGKFENSYSINILLEQYYELLNRVGNKEERLFSSHTRWTLSETFEKGEGIPDSVVVPPAFNTVKKYLNVCFTSKQSGASHQDAMIPVSLSLDIPCPPEYIFDENAFNLGPFVADP